MTVTCLVTLASGEAPVGWCVIRNPGYRQMLGLEVEERRTHNAGRIHHLDRSYPLLPTLYLLPACLGPNADKSSRSLACDDNKTGLIHVVYLGRSVLVPIR
jgi:hypothetical protein